VLDNEAEDVRIRLATERDFYSKIFFDNYLKEQDSDKATAQSLYQFVSSFEERELEAVGTASKHDFENFLRKTNLGKYYVQPEQSDQ